MRAECPTETSHNVDWFIFIGTAVLVVAVCLPLILFPDAGARIVSDTFEFITTYFGFAYVWSATAGLAFLLWLALGRYPGWMQAGVLDLQLGLDAVLRGDGRHGSVLGHHRMGVLLPIPAVR
jgi:hypothetical protein